MEKNNKTRSTNETSYAKRRRRRAEKIIAATGVYSTAFRNEVQQALDNNLPHKLPLLFLEANEIDRQRKSLDEVIRAKMREAGLPIPATSNIKVQPRPRPRKNVVVREAEQIESLFIEHENDRLDKAMAERAELISSILFEAGNEAHVSATHPQIVKAYVLAIWEALPWLGSRHDYEAVQTAFEQVRDLMNGCSQARFEEIDAIYNGDYARKERAGACGEAGQADTETGHPESQESIALTDLATKLAKLERLPENEAVRFQLESEIYQLERESVAEKEWPDVFGEEE